MNFLSYFLLVPLVFLISLIPVSFAGWGIREAGAIWLFGMVNMPKEDALILSIAYGTMLILSGLPGLILFMQSKHLMSKSRNHT